jgi:hypothetical protein
MKPQLPRGGHRDHFDRGLRHGSTAGSSPMPVACALGERLAQPGRPQSGS